MKKFFAFVLAMTVSAVANAGLIFDADSYTVNVGDTVRFNVLSDTDYYGGGLYFMLGNDPYAFATVAMFINVDDIPHTMEYDPTLPNTYIFAQWPIDFGGPYPYPAGTLCSIDILGLAQGDITLSMLEPFTSQVISSAIVHVVPEPLTVGLLGLGGLAAVRRRW